MAFDIEGARKAGYSETEIADHIAKTANFDAPKARQAGYSDSEIIKHLAPDPTMGDRIKQGAKDLAGGAVRGAGSIGATLLAPVDAAARALNGGKPVTVGGIEIAGQDRRAGMDGGLQAMGVDTGSIAFKGGKLAGEIAGTAGAGGAIANGVRAAAPALAAAPRVANLLQATQTAGFQGGKLASRAAGGAINGAVSAGLVNPDDALAGAAVGGALPVGARLAGLMGSAAGKGVRSAVTSVTGKASPEVAALAGRAKQLGIDIPADRIVNSKPLNALASSLSYVPFSGRAATEEKMANQLNTALSRTMGQNTDNVTQAVRTAGKDLGAQFDNVLQNNTLKITPAFKQALAQAEDQATNELGAESAGVIHKQIASILSKGASGEIDGKAAYEIKKALDRIGTRNSGEAHYARELKKSLMNALNESLGPTQAAAFAKTRQQYGNMLALENLAQNGAEGGVSIARVANMRHINNPDLQELADISAQFLKGRESPHGALQRLVIGGTAASVGAPLGALPVVAAGGIAGRAANSALNSNALRAMVTGQAVPSGAVANLLARNPGLRQLGYRAAPNALADQ
jgi:hypothetical protein